MLKVTGLDLEEDEDDFENRNGTFPLRPSVDIKKNGKKKRKCC